jgi:hypothetical protein
MIVFVRDGNITQAILDDQGISARPVVPVAGEQPNRVMVALNEQAEAIVFYLVKPTGV